VAPSLLRVLAISFVLYTAAHLNPSVASVQFPTRYMLRRRSAITQRRWVNPGRSPAASLASQLC
jgi:hypothetical protein